jgi:F0F1-type ATP synthase assembly protein I
MVATILLSIVSPRIPPFVGYFFCQLASLQKDICGMRSFVLKDLLSFTLLDVKTLLRVMNGCLSMLIYIPGCWTGNQMATYEVLPNLLFQSESLDPLKESVKNSRRALSNTNQLTRKYRQLQVINIVFNEIFRRDFFAAVMVGAVLTIVSCGFFLLTSYHHVHPFVLIILAFTTFMAYCIIFTIFVVASKVWTESESITWAWRKNHGFSKSPLARRVGKSFRNMKIEIGRTNFVERNTPFVFVSFCIEQTISLVLLSKR